MSAKKVKQSPTVAYDRNPNYPYIGDIVSEADLHLLARDEALFSASIGLIEKHPDEFTAVVGTPTGTIIANACGSIELPIRTLKLGQKLSLRKNLNG